MTVKALTGSDTVLVVGKWKTERDRETETEGERIYV